MYIKLNSIILICLIVYLANLDVTECCVLALSQGLDHHEGGHEVVLLDVLQHLRDLPFALLP